MPCISLFFVVAGYKVWPAGVSIIPLKCASDKNSLKTDAFMLTTDLLIILKVIPIILLLITNIRLADFASVLAVVEGFCYHPTINPCHDSFEYCLDISHWWCLWLSCQNFLSSTKIEAYFKSSWRVNSFILEFGIKYILQNRANYYG